LLTIVAVLFFGFSAFAQNNVFSDDSVDYSFDLPEASGNKPSSLRRPARMSNMSMVTAPMGTSKFAAFL
jgi:hypothetical protein